MGGELRLYVAIKNVNYSSSSPSIADKPQIMARSVGSWRLLFVVSSSNVRGSSLTDF